MSTLDEPEPRRRPPREAAPAPRAVPVPTPHTGQAASAAEPSSLMLAEVPSEGRPRRALPAKAAAPVRSIAAPMSAEALAAPILEDADRADSLDRAAALLMRLTTVGWIAGAVVLWAHLVGYGGGTLSPSWNDPGGTWLATMIAAVVFPVVAVGLWLLGRWGVVVFAAAIAAGAVLLAVRPDLVPFGPFALAANLAVGALLALVATVRAVRRHRAGV